VIRAAAAVALVALTGCGHGDDAKRTAPGQEPGTKRSAVERDLERVRKSDLPPDAKRELEEAAKLLDQSK
jgi:hypothetical protein